MKFERQKCFFTLIAICLIGGVVVSAQLLISIPSAGDHDRVSSLLYSLVENYSFTTQRADRAGPAVYMIPNGRRDYLSIYGRYSASEIDEITSITKELQAKREERKPIELSFYEEELREETFYLKVVIK